MVTYYYREGIKGKMGKYRTYSHIVFMCNNEEVQNHFDVQAEYFRDYFIIAHYI